MTVGQESLVHELLILPHLTVDIILGMDILSNKFRIDSASNTVFLNGRDVSCRETHPLMYLHVPEEIVEPIPSESFFRNEQRDTLTLILLSPPPIEETDAGSPEGGPGPETDINTTQLVISFFSKRKTCVSKQTSREKPGSARDMPRHIPLNSVSRMHSQSHGTRMEDRTDLRHKFATQVKESTKMVNHSTQTFEDPFEKNGYFHWEEIDSQKVAIAMDCINELTLDMLRPAAAKHLPVSLMPESMRRVRNSIPPPRLPQTTPPAVKDDCPRYLVVGKDLCWRCGYLGHQRQSCRKPWKIFCSRCGRCGVRSADCSCGKCPGSPEK
ncbi:hypothetical protein JTB14_036973 [Gonioctena quinquepunctata]|nr:hypothetical protein JTB14_036973 [Gonioctena quinquepunctata]